MKNKNIISIAKAKDIDEIMKFIKNEWKKNHILAVNKDFFLYEYGNQDLIDFVISKNNDNEINGIQGFLKSSNDKNASVWTTMWSTSKSSSSPMLGVSMLNYLRMQGYRSVMSTGINEHTEEIYKYLGFSVGTLDQYFIPNKNLAKHKIAILPKSILTKSLEINKNEKLIFKKINLNDIDKKFDFNKYSFKLPFKNFNYFKKRFFDHPIYSYDIYGVFDKSKLLSILVIRINEYKNSTCMRVIDFYGEESTLSNFTWHLLQIMHSAGHEYIDLFTKGLDKKIIAKAGFIKVNNKKSDMVIPNYFEPFVQCNITIRYFTDAIELKNLRIYKGDGDQDRPNFITTGD
tara:strand:+ start:1295 stop:2329 length:1035 start_codon:yes stop_codon:yes gene_type:complete